MSEEFARVLMANLNRRIKDTETRHDFAVTEALKQMRDAFRETMQELGHKI